MHHTDFSRAIVESHLHGCWDPQTEECHDNEVEYRLDHISIVTFDLSAKGPNKAEVSRENCKTRAATQQHEQTREYSLMKHTSFTYLCEYSRVGSLDTDPGTTPDI